MVQSRHAYSENAALPELTGCNPATHPSKMTLWVIFDRPGRFCRTDHICSPPKADLKSTSRGKQMGRHQADAAQCGACQLIRYFWNHAKVRCQASLAAASS